MAERHSSTHSSDKFSSSFVVDSAIIENVNSMEESANNFKYITEEDVEEEDVEKVLDNEESGSDESEKEEEILQPLLKKIEARKKKPKGRRPSWEEDAVDDLVNIICEDDYMKRKLIFENTKNKRNSELYEKIIREVKKSCENRDKTFEFDVKQTRTKCKSCISICKNAAMTIRTASGIKRFQEDKNLGKWFNQLYPLVKSRELAQPEQAIEPSSLIRRARGCSKADDSPSDAATSTSAGNSSAISDIDESHESTDVEDIPNATKNYVKGKRKGGKNLYVPVKENKKRKCDDVFAGTATSINKLAEKDNSTTDLFKFLREENERARQHELELYRMQMDLQMQMQMQMIQLLRQHPLPQQSQLHSMPQVQQSLQHLSAQQATPLSSPQVQAPLSSCPTPRGFNFHNQSLSRNVHGSATEAGSDKTFHNLQPVGHNATNDRSYYQLLNQDNYN